MTISGGFQLHFDAGCELQPTSPGAQHNSLDVCGHETLILSRARKKIKDDLAEMDPEVLSPHLQSHLESHADIEHLSAPMSQMEVAPSLSNKTKDSGHSFYITSWLSVLLVLPPLPCFRTGTGKTENRGPRSS